MSNPKFLTKLHIQCPDCRKSYEVSKKKKILLHNKYCSFQLPLDNFKPHLISNNKVEEIPSNKGGYNCSRCKVLLHISFFKIKRTGERSKMCIKCLETQQRINKRNGVKV